MADKKYYSNIDLNQSSVIKNGGFELIAGDPVSPVEGQEWCDTTTTPPTRKVFKNGVIEVYAFRSYVDTEIDKISRYQGSYDASGGGLPAVGDKTQGDLTQLVAGDTWTVSVAGTITGIQGDDVLSVGDELKYLGGVVTDPNSWLGIQRNLDDALLGTTKADRQTVNLVAATGLTVASSTVSDIHSIHVYDSTGAEIEVCVEKTANPNERVLTSNANLTNVVVELVGEA